MLRDEVQKQMVQAMKDQAKERLDALRYLWSLIHNAEIDAKGNVTDAQVIALIQQEVKKRNEAVEQMKQAKREELVALEEKKLVVLKEFLPKQLSEQEVGELVDLVMNEVGNPPAGGFGQIMKAVMAKAAGKADGKTVSEVVKQKLGSS